MPPAGKGKEEEPMNPLIVALVCALLTACGNLSLKIGMLQVGEITLEANKLVEQMFRDFTRHLIILGLALYVISMVPWLVILPRVELNRVYPVFASSVFALVILGSRLLLKEDVSPARILGILVICLGIYIVAKT